MLNFDVESQRLEPDAKKAKLRRLLCFAQMFKSKFHMMNFPNVTLYVVLRVFRKLDFDFGIPDPYPID